jgi:predicted nucleotidyltransferase
MNRPLLARVSETLTARSTYDLDLLATDPRALASETWHELVRSGTANVDIRRGDADDPLAGIVRIEAPDERVVDVIVGRFGWQANAIAAAEPVRVEGVEVPAVTLVDLILLKLYAGGTQDAWDVDQLLAAGDRNELSRQVTARLSALPAEAAVLWARIARGR